ncbi:efflux RND transporter periplasmic adaptor subunit [Methylosinus sporium]|uniref:Efflux RND transporter periplasmic adaptor subunit n=1 Tax=Methylosinus sporium TaxID=428 RepID=A0A549ST07_METSR|nr:efflux RND transporter periplasmic adaptor subunit [Methylosinus sporium]TRL32749.1 efflux RND transporter periplasmic adaptor subunit [Methylosinus sporium]
MRQDVENNVLATGTLQAIRQVDVGTRVSGQLKSLKVKLGEHVQEGQLLAEIDPILPENELRAAQANLTALDAQRRSAVAKARRSKLELDRQRGMIVKSVTSRRDFEAAEAQSLADEASVIAFDAQIAQAKSQADIAAANLGYTKITAPIEGEVVGVLTQEGQTVVAAQIVPVILKLARLDAMTVRTQVSEADVINVKVGQKVSFTVMGDPDKHYPGTLRAVELAPQNYSEPAQAQSGNQSSATTSGTAAIFYNALFDVPNPDRNLRIGMTAQVSITLGVSRNVLTIPASALREQDLDGRYALRVLAVDGRVESRQVRIGVNNHVAAEVVEGLAEGEAVVTGEMLAAGTAPEASK